MAMIKRINGLVVGSLCSLALTGTVHGGGFDYSYAELTYYYNDSDFVEGDGFNVRLSSGLYEYVHLRGSFTRVNMDNFDPPPNVGVKKVDKSEFGLGLGMNYPLVKWLDAVVGAEYLYQNFSGDNRNTEHGYRVDVGARVSPFKRVELELGYLYQDSAPDSQNSEGRHGFFVGPTIKINKTFAVTARTQMADADEGDEKEYFIGLRAMF
jgi:hypothetical protein